MNCCFRSLCGILRRDDSETGQDARRNGFKYSSQPDDVTDRYDLRALALHESQSRWPVELVDRAASADQAILQYVSACGQDATLDRGVGLCARRHR